MGIATSDGVSIYYERHGSGPAILFVHGSGGHHAAWWQQVAALRGRFTIVTVDLRGFGNSDSSMPEFDGQDFPGDILAVLDQEDLTDVLLVGQSIGAVAALRAGLSRPSRVAGVALAHSLGGIADPSLAELVAADRAEAVKLPVLDRLLSADFQQSEPAKTFLFQQMGTFNVAKMADLRNLSAGGPSITEVVASGLDVTFLAGENDAVLSAATVRRAHELVKGSRLELIPGAPHSMYWEAPALFNAAVTRIREAIA
ncbi:alpha/beta fold hydrolase [Paractinoplanes durhamensis]|uniref:2-hydroxy-6-ketonona-2,4-dienedioic acid hydrolase n=1 Tax=Paractinoplanes durhamensis TaxID=113563 RepID=A0ABQ3YWN6_9ACTN|nr:alpha/beta hydrolase [Actinoplanes durhamensis]GIE01997.1 2-hydroxy-6-ketonona-2,4-dienedioic acid hydrolase [Actinoplanes durhamensis]